MVVHNPNNWHWVDRNCLPWSKTYFEENVLNTELKNENVSFLVDLIKSILGDCDVSQRKGKVICIYDMLLQFSVFIEPSGKEGFNATITIPEFVHDQEDDDYVFSIDSEGHVTEIRKYFVPVLKNKLKNFQADLIAAHEKEVQHNTN